MTKQPKTVWVDSGFEYMMMFVFGSGLRGCSGHLRTTVWKKHLTRLFRTLKTAIERNVNGDDRYRQHLMSRCDVAVDSIKDAKLNDEIASRAIQFAFELLFSLLGQMPCNWQKNRVRPDLLTNLADYRTFGYVRTDRQKARQITDAAYYERLQKGDPKFGVLIGKLKDDFHDDPRRFLSWLRENHPSVYDRFI